MRGEFDEISVHLKTYHCIHFVDLQQACKWSRSKTLWFLVSVENNKHQTLSFPISVGFKRTQWRNFVTGCPWVPVAQNGVGAPGEVNLDTTQLIQGCNAQAWVPPKPGCPRVCPPWAHRSYATERTPYDTKSYSKPPGQTVFVCVSWKQ